LELSGEPVKHTVGVRPLAVAGGYIADKPVNLLLANIPTFGGEIMIILLLLRIVPFS